MKQETLAELESFWKELKSLRSELQKKNVVIINQKKLRERAHTLATQWIEKLRSPLEHKFKLPSADIDDMAEQMKQLYRLSLSANRKKSYMTALSSSLLKFNDRFMIPVKESSLDMSTVFDIRSMFPNLSDPNSLEYMKEAIGCADFGYLRAAVVLGWCAVIYRIQSYFLRKGLNHLNRLSEDLKNKKGGKFKLRSRNLDITTESELQAFVDADLITLIEGDNLIDSNQATTLRWCLDIRNQSAHPGKASLTKDRLKGFFEDIRDIIFENEKLNQ